MKLSGNDHLDGARSLSCFFRGISIISGSFWRNDRVGPLHCVGVQNWLLSIFMLFNANQHYFGILFGNPGRDGSYTREGKMLVIIWYFIVLYFSNNVNPVRGKNCIFLDKYTQEF